MGNRGPHKFTAEKRALFLAQLARTYSVTHAAHAAGISRRTAYDWRQTDAEFAKAWDDALEQAVDALEASAYERALKGDTTLTIFLLKAAKPDKYRERSTTELTGPGGGPIRVVFVPPGSDQR